jgi:hypothetical protein
MQWREKMLTSELFVLAVVVVSLALIGIAVYQSRDKERIEGLEPMPMVIAAIGALALLELHRAPAIRPEMLPAVHASDVASTIRESRPARPDEAWRDTGSSGDTRHRIVAHDAVSLRGASGDDDERKLRGR